MKAIVQRVMKASVIGKTLNSESDIFAMYNCVMSYIYLLLAVEDEVISSIGKGLCVLIGISKDDTKRDMEYM
jgi:D-Tyr-tRNAtyr deacylase